MRAQGKTNRETADYINSIKNNLQHFIIADDLKYLCRGGRVSADEIGLPVSGNGLVLPCGATARWEK